MSQIKDLEPKLMWGLFDEITRVPRPSKHEEKIIAYLIDFATKHNLAYRRDAIGNVVICREASKGYEE
ncbi:MAG: cytosol nonspecific dipeptidase, partial [Alistipes sp.]|nr:cytosol nonspecific dipeptidase [Alistipes sp.]